MGIKKLLGCLLLLTSVAFGQQISRYDNITLGITPNDLSEPLIGTTIRLYQFPGDGVSCAGGGCTPAITFTGQATGVTCGPTIPLTRPTGNSCTGQVDAGANFGFWAVSGPYQYCATAAGFGTTCVNISVPLNGAVPGTPTYIFSVSGGIVSAYNTALNALQFSGTDGAVVINQVLSVMTNTGGTLYFKNGTYPLNSCTQETVAPYTTYFYAVGIPSTNTTLYPSFNFVGESAAIGSQVLPVTNGVLFNVTSAAVACKGSGTLLAFWMRPNTSHDADYPPGPNILFWNDHVSFENIAINFPDNSHTNLHGIDALEASYLHVRHVQVGFTTQSVASGAAGTIAMVSPATPSDGVLFEETQIDPGWDTGYQLNTDHSLVINSEVFRARACYEVGWQTSRNASLIYHSVQLIHPQIFECAIGISVGVNAAPGMDLDVLGFDIQYTTSGPWTYTNGIVGSSTIGGFVSWQSILSNVGIGTLTTLFSGNDGQNFTTVNPTIVSTNAKTIVMNPNSGGTFGITPRHASGFPTCNSTIDGSRGEADDLLAANCADGTCTTFRTVVTVGGGSGGGALHRGLACNAANWVMEY